MNKTEEAVKLYCEMLPYANESASPHDDNRLYKIAYWAEIENVYNDDIKTWLEKYLPLNDNINLTNKDLLDPFIENRLNAIGQGRYILDCISDLVFKK